MPRLLAFSTAALAWMMGVAFAPSASADDPIEILMIAGPPSHGFGAHEHYAGLKVLEESLEASSPEIEATVVRGWPEDPELIERADSIVIYADGGGRHVAMDHRETLREKLATGAGFVCIHYAVEMVPGEPGDDWLDLLGGHFEINWSVNPHWVAEFDSLPDHPITRGVEPFSANDEWYFHLRFKDSGVTPILADVAPQSTMRRPDGHHSGNPAVRKSVAAGETQTVAWTYDRSDGGRSFGFTGGHFHWNWASEPYRRLVTNAIRWTAGDEIAPSGSETERVDLPKLLVNQDYDPPENFSADRVAEQFQIPSGDEGSGEEESRDADGGDANGGDANGDDANGDNTDPRASSNALDGLLVPDDLQATLVASEPTLRSLTNLDIDDRGRIWVCDVMNYRRNQGSRPEGDRILILEDTSGDGVADKVKTFYQGRDIDSAMGICVLPGDGRTEVIVSASPTVWRLIDEDGDDVADRKEAMFTETGQPQHDHSAHSFLFGPDGKLYWNFGNTGGQVKDANGETVIDIHGRPVVDDGSPFYGGMPFRCDLDGSHFEVLAHNFRNNYETTIDSFGTLWQSDNDDDGNRGTRINFVMEHGNYGYRDELTGAGWREDRITLEDEIPFRHWHLNDPGVVPNLLQTGAGSPSGICFYEGRLLPERFWDQIIHCDPGPNVVRAYPATTDGAGYTATIEAIMTGVTDTWFRPADVCVAPDGSLFVTDWYDPGVGGHRQGDLDRGRLFRIAPPGVAYRVPEFDFSTPQGAAEALRNPARSVQTRAWLTLHEMGESAEPAVRALYDDPNPRMRARALWLLGKIEGRGESVVGEALSDRDPDIRITAIRLARQLGLVPSVSCAVAADDPSPAVRRELAVSLRFDDSDGMPAVWAKLAAAHDGEDRWYLEALGIGSDLRADACYDAWLERVDGRWDTPAGRDIVWRTRAPRAAEHLAEIIANESIPLAETDRYFRSLEYHAPDVRDDVVAKLIRRQRERTSENRGAAAEHLPRPDAIVARAVERAASGELAESKFVKAAIARHIDRHEGKPEYLTLIRRFRPDGASEAIERVMFAGEIDSDSVEATRMLSESSEGPRRLRELVNREDEAIVTRTATLLGALGNGRSNNILGDLVRDAERPYAVRAAAVRGMAKSNLGRARLLEYAAEKSLPGDIRLLAGGLLATADDVAVRERAAELLPLPQQPNREPLPPLSELAAIRGDVEAGLKQFRTTGSCSNCHIVGGFGKEVGPDLSEIGSKLSREAMLTSILDPNAGISHNYEGYVVLLDSGQVVTGLKMSETDDKVVIRDAEAIDREIDRDGIEMMKKSEVSIMPENLHHATGQQGLIDIVEYLMTLKKK